MEHAAWSMEHGACVMEHEEMEHVPAARVCVRSKDVQLVKIATRENHRLVPVFNQRR